MWEEENWTTDWWTVDITEGSTAVTVTNFYFTEHDKVMLLDHLDDFLANAGMQKRTLKGMFVMVTARSSESGPPSVESLSAQMETLMLTMTQMGESIRLLEQRSNNVLEL
ncbi:pectin lyase fold/virulence factor, AmbAllergen [Artemisia annua]|uniref:Pectin lyase fold/virulence factor, AmbAllergen n=1 Tax=Artemisia annua TaxID=35608 RepID=A0A2U1NG07_ARTAN|nr:pectin lyase fold/virulence factor, AmbAllergen [Artemisia annua]